MQIGELSACTAASVRSLRYYEQQGLLTCERRGNGYREYPPSAVATVKTIQALIDLGLPTSLVKDVLPCTLGSRDDAACPELLERVRTLRNNVQSKAERLRLVEQSLAEFLNAEGQRSSP